MLETIAICNQVRQMPYLEWIRERVGHQKILLVYASACVRDDAGRVLWQRRADFGWWGLPGGVLELHESLPDCVLREVREETGLSVAPIRLVGVYSSPEFDVIYPNGDQVQQVTACFECRVTSDLDLPSANANHLSQRSVPVAEVASVKAPGSTNETLDLAWFPLSAPPPTAAWYAAMIEDLASGRQAATFNRGRLGTGRGEEPYFRAVRQHLGRSAFVMPAAAAFVRDEHGRVLLQRRSDTGGWGLPGGAMELGERADQTVVSEVREETGLEVEPVRLIGVYSDAVFWFTYPHGDQVKVVSMLFECKTVGGSLRADGIESLDVRFLPTGALPAMEERHARRVRDGLAGREAAFF
jgi:ADP-ribose pyrophosphatase YjhB (NUDIX family)